MNDAAMRESAPVAEASHHTAIFDDGFRLHYVEAGAGEPLLLLHGFPETWLAWRKVIPALARHFRVIAPDLRGCGDTDRPPAGYDKRTVAADLGRLVDLLGFEAIGLVGHDVGMMVAYAYACANRNAVTRLVLMEAALPGLGLEALYDAIKYPRMYHLPLFDAPNQLAETLIAGRERMFVEHFMRQQTYDPSAIDAATLDEYARHLRQPGCLQAGIAYFRSHPLDAEHNRENAETRLAVPVMTVGGTASFGRGLEAEIRPLVEHLEPVMIDRCGHYLAEERPDALVGHLLRFLGKGSGT